MSKSQLEDDLGGALSQHRTAQTAVGLLEPCLKEKDLPEILSRSMILQFSLDGVHDFLAKYNDFLELVETKFGITTKQHLNILKQTISDLKQAVDELKTMASQDRFDTAEGSLKRVIDKAKDMKNNFEVISSVPWRIDYSRLDDADWKKIGIPGVHYRSKVFLSYAYRDDDPKKDKNQEMIDHYIMPLLQLLNIEPLISRGRLRTQDLVDDKTTVAIKNCDGIMGFYTKGDSVSNVEHELAQNSNIVAICAEREASTPSMRRSRWQIDFDRDAMGDLMIELIQALKGNGLFRLVAR